MRHCNYFLAQIVLIFEKQTNNKLNLKKLNFNIVSFEEPFNPFNFSIDSEDSDFEKIIELLEDYGVYKWYDKDYAENIIESDDGDHLYHEGAGAPGVEHQAGPQQKQVAVPGIQQVIYQQHRRKKAEQKKITGK